MRFPLAALLFIIAGFIFFVIWAVISLLLNETYNALSPLSVGLDAKLAEELALIPTAFGILAALFFIVGIILIFVLDTFQDEPETYWR